jgi:hypothetical protein
MRTCLARNGIEQYSPACVASRRELQGLAMLRLREAEALFAAELYDGCVYLCGYVVEVALKARICATLGVDDYPEKGSRLKDAFKTHDFDDLKLLAGMDKEFSANNDNPVPFANWSVATKWEPEWRYKPQGSHRRPRAEAILNAIRAKPDGVLACISSHW